MRNFSLFDFSTLELLTDQQLLELFTIGSIKVVRVILGLLKNQSSAAERARVVPLKYSKRGDKKSEQRYLPILFNLNTLEFAYYYLRVLEVLQTLL